MAKLHLTKSNIDAIEPGAKDVLYFDTELSGYALKVTPAGRRVYLIQYRIGGRTGKSERYTIGVHGQLTCDQARRTAKSLLGKVAEGISPQENKRQVKRERSKALETTTAALNERFYKTRSKAGKLRPEHVTRVYRRLKYNVVPYIGDRDFASVTRAEKYALIDRLIAAGKNGSAYNVRRDLSALENWALDRGIIATSNGQRMKIDIPFPERTRVLSDDELRAVLAQLDAEPEPTRTGYLVLALTLQRIESVSAMRRSMVKGNVWTQKPEPVIYKGKSDHELPLPPEVMDLLDALPNTGDFYFPGAGNSKTGYYQLASTHRRNKITGATGINDWTWHDLRRTGATWLQDAGVEPHRIDAVLGHTAKGETSSFKHYGRAQMLKVKEQTLQAWVNHVLHPERSNIVTFGKAAVASA